MFDESKASRAINFFERHLRHTKGRFAGQPFILAPWQRKLIGELFGTVGRDGLRQYRRAYCEVPKKNGKSELAAGVALYLLLADGEPGAEIYSAAATRDQASIVFRVAASMVRRNQDLAALCKIIDSTKTIYLKDDNDSFYKAISADAGTQDGINPHGVVFDELHRQKKRDLWDVLTYGTDTRSQPMTFAITTAGVSDESPICWDQHEYARQVQAGAFKDRRFYPCLYGLDESADWTKPGRAGTWDKAKNRWKRKPTGWYAANPSLEGNPGGFIKRDTIKTACAEAQRSLISQNSFRRFRLNQWVRQESRWIDMRQWDKCGKAFNVADLAGAACYGGLDLSTTGDITAFVLAFEVGDSIALVPTFWLPEEGIAERARRQSVPYDHWAAAGLLNLTPGNVIDYAHVRKTIAGLAEVYDIQQVGYDRWNATQLTTELSEQYGLNMVPIGQGYASLSAPAKAFESMVQSKKIKHGNNPILRWMADCCAVSQDPAGNIKPVKPDRSKSNKRIDGIVASVMAIDCWTRSQAAAPIEIEDLAFA